MELSEAEIKASILTFLRAIPGVYARVIAVVGLPGRGSPSKGIPDVVCVVRGPDGKGETHWIEVKRSGGKLSPEQAEFIDSWRACGGSAFVATCVEDVIKNIPALPQQDLFTKAI